MMDEKYGTLITQGTILLDLDAESKFDAIRALCGLLFSVNRTENPKLLYQDIIKREETVSTFAGMQTAIPHAITRYISEPTLCFARMGNDEFTWDGADEKVKFVFLLSAPAQDDLKKLRQSQSYVFSSIAQLIGEPDTLTLWESATDAHEILDGLRAAFQAFQDS